MKRILIMLAAVGILLLMASCGRDSARVEICSDGSWLGDYTITGGQVDFFCTVKIKNTGSEEQKINLYGDFSEDMAGGLLKTGRLIAHPADDPAGTVLSVLPGEHAYEVVFTGEYAGTPVKQDRLPPPLEIVPLTEAETN